MLGDTTVEVSYTDYRDVGGVKFPTRIRQTMGAFPTLDLTVTDVKPNAPVDIPVPDTVSQSASGPYARVTTRDGGRRGLVHHGRYPTTAWRSRWGTT